MKKFKIRIIAAGVSIIAALVLLVSASVAWLTISTKPEVGGIHVGINAQRTLLLSRDTDVLEFNQYIDLTDDFAYLTPLRPVSTVDGIHWFIPTYNTATGALNDPDEFILDTTLQYANVTTLAGNSNDIHNRSAMYDPEQPGQLKAAEDIQELTGAALLERSNQGYYVYTDFWMTTEEDNGCRVRLTIPHYPTRDGFQKEEIDQGRYGSYALQTYALREGEDGQQVALLSRNAETSMRIGLLLNPDQPASSQFFIYEPNADRRSAANKPLGGEEEENGGIKVDYVVDYRFNEDSYKAGAYFVTQPIRAVTKTRDVTDPDSGENVTETYIGGEPTNIPTNRLLIQKSSDWDLDSLKEKLENGESPNSNDVQYPFGGFLDTANVYSALDKDENSEKDINNPDRIVDISDEAGAGHTDIAGSSVIVTLTKDTPIKCRLFIWLEGQDVDCWNDISAGSFIVNLELAGESIPN